MTDSDIRWRIVRRMWNDNILRKVKFADVETVADFAVDSSSEGRAKELIRDEMVSDSECPVVWGIAGEAITLENDPAAVARYINKHGGREALPWDLRDEIEEPTEETRATEQRN